MTNEQREAYRQAARNRFENDSTVEIATFANVHPLEDGAFVEAVVWVPNDQMLATPATAPVCSSLAEGC